MYVDVQLINGPPGAPQQRRSFRHLLMGLLVQVLIQFFQRLMHPATGYVLGHYFKKSAAENAKGGITYDAIFGTSAVNSTPMAMILDAVTRLPQLLFFLALEAGCERFPIMGGGLNVR